MDDKRMVSSEWFRGLASGEKEPSNPSVPKNMERGNCADWVRQKLSIFVGQMLGCVELSHMAKYSRSKRRQIFCLTTLGAQLVNWLNLRNVCIIQLTRFVDSLNSYRGQTTANGYSITSQYHCHLLDDDDDSCVTYSTAVLYTGCCTKWGHCLLWGRVRQLPYSSQGSVVTLAMCDGQGTHWSFKVLEF